MESRISQITTNDKKQREDTCGLKERNLESRYKSKSAVKFLEKLNGSLDFIPQRTSEVKRKRKLYNKSLFHPN